jgi:hypothetical protein
MGLLSGYFRALEAPSWRRRLVAEVPTAIAILAVGGAAIAAFTGSAQPRRSTVGAAVLASPSATPAVSASASPTSGATPSAVPLPSDVLFVSGGSLTAIAASQAGGQLGRSARAVVHQRTGFTRTVPPGGKALPSLLADDLEVVRAPLVVLQGGEADNGVSQARLVAAVIDAVAQVRAHAQPGVALVLLGPIPASLPAPPSFTAVSRALGAAASLARIRYKDTVQAGWALANRNLPAQIAAFLRTVRPGIATPSPG